MTIRYGVFVAALVIAAVVGVAFIPHATAGAATVTGAITAVIATLYHPHRKGGGQ